MKEKPVIVARNYWSHKDWIIISIFSLIAFVLKNLQFILCRNINVMYICNEFLV